MAKQTKMERAGQIGVSYPCLRNWERCGVDIWSDDDVRAKLARMRNLPPNLKPEFMPTRSAPIEPPGEDPTQIDIESIIGQLSSVTDKHQAQTVKLQIDGLLNAYKLREAAGKYVARAMVEESLIRIGATFKAALMRLEADLPPMMEGMDPPKMQQTIRDKIDEVLRSLEDEYAKAYDHPD